MRKLLPLILFFLFLKFSFGQATFQKTFGGSGFDVGTSIAQTSDGGYLIAGSTDTSALLIKTNINGDTVWTRNYYDNWLHPRGYTALETYDGNFILSGSDASGVFIIKTNTSGNLLWNRQFSGFDSSESSIIQISDSGFIIIGTARHQNWDSTYICLVRTTSNGLWGWENRYAAAARYNQGYAVKQTSDGQLVVTGTRSYSESSLLRIGSGSGVVISSKGFGSVIPHSVLQTNGGFIVAGTTYDSWSNTPSNICISKTSLSGWLEWTKGYGGDSNDVAKTILQTADSGYILVGTTYSYGAGDGDVLLIKTDSLANIIWAKTFGGLAEDIGNSIKITNDGGYIIAGTTKSFGSGNSDIYIIKTDSLGRSSCNEHDVTLPITSSAAGGVPITTWRGYYNSSSNVTYSVNSGATVNTICFAPCTFSLSITSPGISCYGDSTTATAIPIGGTGPYTYTWTPTGDTTATINNLNGGNYTVTVYDSLGCSATQTIVITEPAPIILSLSVTDASCSTCSDGVIVANVNGGTGAYTYTWSFGAGSDTATNLSPGVYSVCVNDANGCSACTSATVSFPTFIRTINRDDAFIIHPNPFNNTLTVIFTQQPAARNQKQVTIIDITGKEILRQQTSEEEIHLNTANLAVGFYLLRVGGENYKVVKGQ
jgi:hypothetical protein